MNPDTAKAFLPILQALAEGKPVQRLNDSGTAWEDCSQITPETDPAGAYRIKPTTTLRPWKPEEVPLGSLFCFKEQRKEPSLILGVAGQTFQIPMTTQLRSVGFREALESGEYSTDNGKTWHPCSVEEVRQ